MKLLTNFLDTKEKHISTLTNKLSIIQYFLIAILNFVKIYLFNKNVKL